MWVDLGGKTRGAEMSRGRVTAVHRACAHNTWSPREDSEVLPVSAATAYCADQPTALLKEDWKLKGRGEGVSRGNLPVPLSSRRQDVCKKRTLRHTHNAVTCVS